MSTGHTLPKLRVELHCHSTCSDGVLPPEPLAIRLAEAGVEYAALTDHDTLAGQAAFLHALARRGIGRITGLEMTTRHGEVIVHLLAYGFDLRHPELTAALAAPAAGRQDPEGSPASFPPASADAIALIHRAGGRAMLAHPNLTEPDDRRLKTLVKELRNVGLDGIEALHGQATAETRDRLVALADSFGLVVSAGTDYHAPGQPAPGIDMPRKRWKAFRDTLLRAESRPDPPPEAPALGPPARRVHWFSFLLNIVLPAGLALGLFVFVLFTVLLPHFEDALMARKRDGIRELIQVAWGVLNEAAQQAEAGRTDLAQAQEMARERIRAMRYGTDEKNYFWLQDLTPRMVMHPYRPDLEGRDMSDYRDPHGIPIFVAFADLVRRQGEGFISYVWQWKDVEERLEPKESYIRLFEPWGWIVGTGIYVHDVQAEIDRLRGRLVRVALSVSGAVLVLMLYLVRQGLRLERLRGAAEEDLRESSERYRALTHAATEGALFISGGRCRYANPVMQELAGYTGSQLEWLDPDDLFPDVAANAAWRKHLARAEATGETVTVDGILERLDGTRLKCTLTLRPVPDGSRTGFMVLVRRNLADADSPGASRMTLNRLLQLPGTVAGDLCAAIAKAADTADVAAQCRRTPELARSLLEHGASVTAITRMLASVTDAATQRLVGLATDALGPPPAPFAFLALGSQGRRSQTLFTDQDNGLILVPAEGTGAKALRPYFLEMGKRVCDGLNEAGYRYCGGKTMACNPRWCQPLPAWRDDFENWIRRAEPQELMNLSIFFDFRTVSGDPAPARALRAHIAAVLRESPHCFPQLAQNVMQFSPPLRLFGTLIAGGGEAPAGRIDIKAATMTIVGFARLYGLRQGIQLTGTIERLEALSRMGVLLDSERFEILSAYEALVRLRLRHQATAIEQGRRPDNWIDPRRLGHIDEAVLRECFKEIEALQNRIRRDFLGG